MNHTLSLASYQKLAELLARARGMELESCRLFAPDGTEVKPTDTERRAG